MPPPYAHRNPPPPPGIAQQAGVVFGPNASGKLYLSANTHRGAGNPYHKSVWLNAISRTEEFLLFCDSDVDNWRDDVGNYWAVKDGGRTILGQDRERLAKFPRNNNARHPWHGFPVSPLDSVNDKPEDQLVEAWIATNVVPKEIGRKIQKYRI